MKLLSFAWNIFRPYRYYIFLMLFTGALWGTYISTSSYLLKIIIDNLSEYNSAKKVYMPATAYVLLYLFSALNFRALDCIKYKILPPIKKAIAMKMFDYIKKRQ